MFVLKKTYSAVLAVIKTLRVELYGCAEHVAKLCYTLECNEAHIEKLSGRAAKYKNEMHNLQSRYNNQVQELEYKNNQYKRFREKEASYKQQIAALRLQASIDRNTANIFKGGSVGVEQFSKAEIKSLISLCHPDKHNGKVSANTMTAKLVEMRDSHE